MDELDVLARDIGLGARGKSNPMRSAPFDRQSIDGPLFSDVFGGKSKHTADANPSPNSNNKHSVNDFDYDSFFKPSAVNEPKHINNSSSKSSTLPIYDKPVYDEDIFNGLPGLKSKPAATAVSFEDDVFSTISSPPASKGKNQSSGFDDLLEHLGRNEKARESNASINAKSSSSAKGFDDLLPGFGSASSVASNRPIPESRWGSVPTAGSKNGNMLDDPFVVLESDSTQHPSSGVFTDDPLEEIGKLGKSRSARAEVSSGTGGTFDDLDILGTEGESPFRSAMPQSVTAPELMGNSSFRYSENSTAKNDSVGNLNEPPSFDVPNVSTDSPKSFDLTSSPQYYEKVTQVDMTPESSGKEYKYDDVWLIVSEIPLFTQPTAAPPPSRPPPPIPCQSSRSETGSNFWSSRKKGDDFSLPSYISHHSQSTKLDSSENMSPLASQLDELDDFAMGRSQNSSDESANLHSATNPFSAAAASAAAMKDELDKAEAKFKHAKEVCERVYAKVARYQDSRPLEKDETDSQEKELKEAREALERERKQKEEEEEGKMMRRLERERLREIEREKARQAVVRATREARERAAAEARLKAERAAVEKANAEARERAERVAVQRAQAEARERAAAEARERVAKATAEARERAAVEAREKETRERAAVVRAEAEARRRAERAAVERAAGEARERAAAEALERATAEAEARRRAERAAVERAAAEARERAAAEALERATAEAEARRRAERAAVERAATEARERAAADALERAAAASKLNQQKNDNDLESFFSMGRASSAPRARTNSTDPFSDQFQNKGGSEAAKRTPSSGATSNMKKASSTINFVDDLSSIFGTAFSAGEFQEVEGETDERRRARLDRNQRTQERAAKALAVKNERDLLAQREQEERHRMAETLDIEIKRWAAGKEGNLRALLSTLQYVLWPECGWQPVSLTDLIIGASVKKVYRKATLCVHPDKVQQKGATLQQKYIAEKVFDLLKEAWNKFNSEELF